MKKTHVRLSTEDWDVLKAYNARISCNILKKLPSDSGYSYEDVSSEVYGVFVTLLNEYKCGVMSPTSYCWQFAESRATDNILREYRRLRSQLDISEMLDPDDDVTCCHKYGPGDVKRLVVDERGRNSAKIDAKYFSKKATAEDRPLMEMVLDGMNYHEISRKTGISPSTISRRLAKYRRVA